MTALLFLFTRHWQNPCGRTEHRWQSDLFLSVSALDPYENASRANQIPQIFFNFQPDFLTFQRQLQALLILVASQNYLNQPL